MYMKYPKMHYNIACFVHFRGIILKSLSFVLNMCNGLRFL